jgi:hypothetical protein
MRKKLRREETSLLEEIVARRCSKVSLFTVPGRLRPLNRQEREHVVNALSQELSEAEVAEDGELTRRGKAIDRLIGLFVPFDRPMGDLGEDESDDQRRLLGE